LPVKKKNKSGGKGNAELDSILPAAQVNALIALMEERGLEEFEFERAGLRIRIKRRGAGAAPPPVFETIRSAPSNPGPGAGPASAESTAAAAAEAEFRGEDVHIVKSPIVGTFYAASRPDAPAFVGLGDAVAVGQTLCIIEAMKLMNEIEADVAGEIVRIYVENAQPVEYGEPLFALRPVKKK